jgi:N-formylglutamate amidohydrolase
VTDGYSLHTGSLPLLVSVPHDGRQLPDDIDKRMTAAGRSIPDTDWHVARLYDFARDLGASMIVAEYSRYVIDLNRPPDDNVLYEGQLATGLCPRKTFAGDDIYRDSEPIDVAARVERYWRPYHDQIRVMLAKLKSAFGYVLLWDAHSIPSRVPRLFTGELPVLNLGSWDGRSCGRSLLNAVVAAVAASEFTSVCDARFKGGFITRHYGDPGNDVHVLQLELAQRAYMDETTLDFDDKKADLLRATLAKLLMTFLDTAERIR